MTQNDKKKKSFRWSHPRKNKNDQLVQATSSQKEKKAVSFGEEKLICEMTEVKNENMIHDAVMIQFIFARRFTTALSKGHRNEELEPWTWTKVIEKCLRWKNLRPVIGSSQLFRLFFLLNKEGWTQCVPWRVRDIC